MQNGELELKVEKLKASTKYHLKYDRQKKLITNVSDYATLSMKKTRWGIDKKSLQEK